MVAAYLRDTLVLKGVKSNRVLEIFRLVCMRRLLNLILILVKSEFILGAKKRQSAIL